jgi:hypothetical protein
MGQINLILFSHETNKPFLDSCSATNRNGTSISAHVIDDTIKTICILELRFFLLFSDDMIVVLDFVTFQDKNNIGTLSVKIKLNCTDCKAGQKSSPQARFFLHVYKACTNKLHFCRQFTYI